MADTLHQIARFLVPSWPLLAACLMALLPEARALRSARHFALAGLVLTLCLSPLLPAQDLLSRWGCLMAGAMPFLALGKGETRLTLCLDFVSACLITLALCAHDVLTVVCLTGCAALMLTYRETLATTRARQAWDSMRMRLAGLVLALLGTSLITMSPDPAILRLGDLFLAVGLCLLSGLGTIAPVCDGTMTGKDGSAVSLRTDRLTALPDMLLCLSAVALMLRLPAREVTHMVPLSAGIAGLWLCILTRQDGPRLLVCLATIAAALPTGPVPSLLFLSSGLALAAGPQIPDSMRRWVISSLPPWPNFTAGCLTLAGLSKVGLIPTVIVLAALGLTASRATLDWHIPLSWRDRALVLALVGMGIIAPLVLGLNAHGSPVGALSWSAP
ncbi:MULTISPECIES: hypothetical protein [Asaia]|uniref:Uncharacterized protein n=1 Tax=Asaia bogorensis TaxID=91915 RepID=A0A060QM58_9PROT|nr:MULTISPECIES: hypothetical protein [Asaia]CDG40952.1 hypothetical protein ASAP_2907 [Asaia bogorensis]